MAKIGLNSLQTILTPSLTWLRLHNNKRENLKRITLEVNKIAFMLPGVDTAKSQQHLLLNEILDSKNTRRKGNWWRKQMKVGGAAMPELEPIPHFGGFHSIRVKIKLHKINLPTQDGWGNDKTHLKCYQLLLPMQAWHLSQQQTKVWILNCRIKKNWGTNDVKLQLMVIKKY